MELSFFERKEMVENQLKKKVYYQKPEKEMQKYEENIRRYQDKYI